MNERDKQMVDERENYENEFFSQIIDEMIESDALDKLIAERLNYIDDNFDFEPSPEYMRLEEIYFSELESKFNQDDDDYLDFIDYPQEPEPDYELFERQMSSDVFIDDFEPDFPDMEEPIEEYYYDEYPHEEFYNEVLENIAESEPEEEDFTLSSLINQHLKDEKEFFDSLVVEVIQEQFYFQKAIDELIMENLEIPYYDYEIEYEEPYWYDETYDDELFPYWNDEPDESVIDPFDKPEEIDYPDGEPEYVFEEPLEWRYQEETERDFQKYMRDKARRRKPSNIRKPPEFDDVDEKRNEKLIENHQKVESVFKEYFTKNEDLDGMIKEKLKEKKFNS